MAARQCNRSGKPGGGTWSVTLPCRRGRRALAGIFAPNILQVTRFWTHQTVATGALAHAAPAAWRLAVVTALRRLMTSYTATGAKWSRTISRFSWPGGSLLHRRTSCTDELCPVSAGVGQEPATDSRGGSSLPASALCCHSWHQAARSLKQAPPSLYTLASICRLQTAERGGYRSLLAPTTHNKGPWVSTQLPSGGCARRVPGEAHHQLRTYVSP